MKILNRLRWTGILAAAIAALLAGCDDSDAATGTAATATAMRAPQAINILTTRAVTTTESKPGGSPSGSATLSWNAPTSNTNGSALMDLSGYRIYYGSSEKEMTETVQISNVGIQTYVIENLEPGTWYFAVRAVSGDTESNLSDVVSKTIG